MHCEYADTDTASRYVAGTLADAEPFEEHMFECEACAEEVEKGVAIRRALRKPRTRLRWIPLAAAAALAAIVFVLVPRDTPDVMRGTAQAIVVKAVAQRGEVRVEWAAVKGAARYVVTLSAEDGTPLRQRDTTETTVAFKVESAAPAFATVRAMSAEGEEIARSRPQRVTILHAPVPPRRGSPGAGR